MNKKKLTIKRFHSMLIITLFVGMTLAGCSSGGTDSNPDPDPGPDPQPQPTAFDSGSISPGGSYSFTFNSEAAIDYICTFHSDMEGDITIEEGADLSGEVTITIENFTFNPASVTIAPGTEVTWVNNDEVAHTATSQ